MLELSIPQSENILFETTLEPTTFEVNKLRKNMGEGEIKTIFGYKNKVAIGEPYSEDLVARIIKQGGIIPHEVENMVKDHDFHFVALSCSFQPDRNCRFVWARFGAELSAISQSGETFKKKPVVYDMFPDEVLSESKYKIEGILEQQLKLKVKIINYDIKDKVAESEEFVIYEPQIYAFGIGRPTIAWNFESTKEKGIWGNKRNLLLIIKTRKGTKVKGKFLLGAEVEYNVGKWIRVPLAKRKDEITEVEYDLSKPLLNIKRNG